MITFWTTRVGAIYELYFAARADPLGPPGANDTDAGLGAAAAQFLPFQWTFYFPIKALVGKLSPAEAADRPGDAAPVDPDGVGLGQPGLALRHSRAIRRWEISDCGTGSDAD